jgi:hypothetical protein
MTPEQAAATEMFRHNLLAHDPDYSLWMTGEYGQTYRPAPGGLEAIAPIKYREGGGIGFESRMRPKDMTQIIHSHPIGPNGGRTDFPSPADYLATYIHSRGNTGKLEGSMLYHVLSDTFYGWKAKLNPDTGAPEYHRLRNPYRMDPPRIVDKCIQSEAYRTLPGPDSLRRGISGNRAAPVAAGLAPDPDAERAPAAGRMG